MDGYIKLYRKLLDNPVFQNANLLKVFIWCLMKATYKPRETLMGLKVVNISTGQFVYGRKRAAEELKMPESSIRNYMNTLKKLKILDIKSDNKYSIVTVVNWVLYQSEEEKQDSNRDESRTSAGQVQDTNKKDKKDKNDKEIIKHMCVSCDTPAEKPNDDGGAQVKPGKGEYTSDFEEFWKHYPRSIEKKGAFKAWNARLKENVTPDTLIKAAKNYALYCKGTEERYIKHPSTFLGPNKPYEEYINCKINETSGIYKDMTNYDPSKE